MPSATRPTTVYTVVEGPRRPQSYHSSTKSYYSSTKSNASTTSSKSSSSSKSSKKDRVVGFEKDPVSAVSRPVNEAESWATWGFEEHARKCVYCENPYEAYRHRHQLCEQGHRLAQEVARYIYNSEGETYSTVEEDTKLVRVEVPAAYKQVRSLLKAIDRSLRHRSRSPFVSMDRTYYVAARLPERRRTVIEQTGRPRYGEVVTWPAEEQPKQVLSEINNTVNARRGSLYVQDMAQQRMNEKRYKVEVREPSTRDIREKRHSGYYR